MKHGHVDHVHWAFFEGHIAEFRTFLRKAGGFKLEGVRRVGSPGRG